MKAFVAIFALATVVWMLTPAESKRRFEEIGDDASSVQRVTYWKDGIEIANAHPLLGIGYRNWVRYYTTVYRGRGQLPHNFLIEAFAELGYTGLLAILAVIATSFAATAKVRTRTGPRSPAPDRLLWAIALGLDGALIGFIVSGSFVSVLYYPFLWMNVAMTMALVRVEKSRATVMASLANSATRMRALGSEKVAPSISAPATIRPVSSEGWV
jgi:O-antigen ligase